MKKGKVTLIAFADFSKAFDTVDYSIVLRKLHAIGFSSSSLNWLLSYLTGSSQFVQINDKHSASVNIQFGVPQGSILGPVLFNLYVNDLQKNHECSCFQYADDTTLYDHCSPRDLSVYSNRMEATMSQLESWASESNLLMNGDKTKQMLLTTPQMSKVHNLEEFIPPLSVGGQAVEKVKTFKLLGTWINENLKWSDPVKHVLSSCLIHSA